MKMNIKVSIVIPCYNQGKYLDDALNSINSQTDQSWECIIINDGSTDETTDIALQWVNRDERFKYFKIDNSGVSQARNFGIKKSNGEFVLPLDADDTLSNNYIESCLRTIENSDAKVVYGKAEFFGEKTGGLYLRKPSLENLLRFNCIHNSAMFRKRDWELIGGYDTNMKFGFEDWEFWINMLKDESTAVLNSDIVLNYRIKDISRSTNLIEDDNKNLEMRDYIFNKHRELYGYNFVYELYRERNELLEKLRNKELSLTLKEIWILFINKVKRRLFK